ncbi:hypothetical protein [Bradyrhizobium cosmicum]|uniref:hypothetical protein n=1 Tax=Bradyrhizobium cosmicum TaxID=1404864 RepID=UPI0011623A05|nr:hypothetical protein [Bradyrhizobium cosmicum]QDP20651.1 hypothetical protein FNV92_00120 [Bradyrhizobium cosmicum]QDP27001.1 hypothetical protein FNV92_34815 [Bradyrhizobium cosmicum]
MGWSAPFDTPIALPGRRELVTLRDAGAYIAALPAATQKRPEWQAATEALMLVAERDGDPMLARIGMLQALSAGKPAPAVERKKAVKRYRLIR